MRDGNKVLEGTPDAADPGAVRHTLLQLVAMLDVLGLNPDDPTWTEGEGSRADSAQQALDTAQQALNLARAEIRSLEDYVEELHAILDEVGIAYPERDAVVV